MPPTISDCCSRARWALLATCFSLLLTLQSNSYVWGISRMYDGYNGTAYKGLLCSVSRTVVDTYENGLYGYPLDQYMMEDESEEQTNERIASINTTHCRLGEDLPHPTSHPCEAGNATVCPLRAEDIFYAKLRTKHWQISDSICKFREGLKDLNVTSNVFFAGGAMTIGRSTGGCVQEGRIGYDHEICRWSGKLYSWFTRQYNITFNRVDLSKGGWSAIQQSHLLPEMCRELGITEISENDIIFIDNSIGDRTEFLKLLSQHELLKGIDNLIQSIYSLVKGDRYPTIILLDMFPKDAPVHYNETITDQYTKLAQHYNIPLWSYRDAVFTKKNRIQSKYLRPDSIWEDKDKWEASTAYRMMNHLMMQKMRYFPPWHVHAFYADLIAGCLLDEFSQCDREKNARRTHGQPSRYVAVTEVMTSPLVDDVEPLYCNASIPPMLHMTADLIGTNMEENRNFFTVGRYMILGDTEPAEWVAGEKDGDKKTTFTSQFTENHNTSHHTIAFYLSDPLNFVNDRVPPQHDRPYYLLEIQYYGSYSDAGKVHVFLCKEPLTYLEALRSNLTTFDPNVPIQKMILTNLHACRDEKSIGLPMLLEFVHEKQVPVVVEVAQVQDTANVSDANMTFCNDTVTTNCTMLSFCNDTVTTNCTMLSFCNDTVTTNCTMLNSTSTNSTEITNSEGASDALETPSWKLDDSSTTLSRGRRLQSEEADAQILEARGPYQSFRLIGATLCAVHDSSAPPLENPITVPLGDSLNIAAIPFERPAQDGDPTTSPTGRPSSSPTAQPSWDEAKHEEEEFLAFQNANKAAVGYSFLLPEGSNIFRGRQRRLRGGGKD